MNFQTLNKQKKFILISAAVGIISMFLPWFKIEFFGLSQSINGMHGSGILVFLCFVAAGILSFLGDQTKNLDRTFWFITLICGGVAAVIMIWAFINGSGYAMSFLSFGFYLALLAAIGVLASAYLFRNATDSIKDGFDSLKKDIEAKTHSSDTP